jgi:hypothetical protein
MWCGYYAALSQMLAYRSILFKHHFMLLKMNSKQHWWSNISLISICAQAYSTVFASHNICNACPLHLCYLIVQCILHLFCTASNYWYNVGFQMQCLTVSSLNSTLSSTACITLSPNHAMSNLIHFGVYWFTSSVWQRLKLPSFPLHWHHLHWTVDSFRPRLSWIEVCSTPRTISSRCTRFDENMH